MESCVFPDHPRKRPSEHFVNLTRDSKGLTTDECPTAPKCALTAILNDSKMIASKDAKKADRLAMASSEGTVEADDVVLPYRLAETSIATA